MFRSLIVEFLLPLLLFMLLRSLLRGMFASSVPQRARQAPPPPVTPGGELKKDPVCGTYVSTATSIREKIHGEVVYFCSAACRDKYKP